MMVGYPAEQLQSDLPLWSGSGTLLECTIRAHAGLELGAKLHWEGRELHCRLQQIDTSRAAIVDLFNQVGHFVSSLSIVGVSDYIIQPLLRTRSY